MQAALEALLRLANVQLPPGADDAAAAAAALDAERRVAARLADAAQLQKDNVELKQRAASLQMQLADMTLENVELRREVAGGWQAAEPAVQQVRQMLLDPAVHREFERLKGDLQQASVQAHAYKEALDGVQYTQDSKMGRKLVAKCQQLLQENQALGRELASSAADAVERQLLVARSFACDLQAALQEMRDLAVVLEEEQEDLLMAVFLQKRRADHLEARQRAPQEQAARI